MHQEPEQWTGVTHGEPRQDSATSRAKRKRITHSGSEPSTPRTPRPPVVKPTQDYIEHVNANTRRARERADLPVEQWNAMDLAVAWQRRLREHGFNSDLGSLKALAGRFAQLQKAGASNEELDAMSEHFFLNPGSFRARHGDQFKRFIAQSSSLLQKVQGTTLATSGGYATTRNPTTHDGQPLAEYMAEHAMARLIARTERMKDST